MNWTSDKIKHYTVCFNAVNGTPILLRPISFVLMLLIGVLKELVWDLILRQGHCELDDFKANWYGCVDGLLDRS